MIIKYNNGYKQEFEEMSVEELLNIHSNLVGWNDLIKNLIEDLFELGWNGEINCLKSKFGGLRFYISENYKEKKIYLTE